MIDPVKASWLQPRIESSLATVSPRSLPNIVDPTGSQLPSEKVGFDHLQRCRDAPQRTFTRRATCALVLDIMEPTTKQACHSAALKPSEHHGTDSFTRCLQDEVESIHCNGAVVLLLDVPVHERRLVHLDPMLAHAHVEDSSNQNNPFSYVQ